MGTAFFQNKEGLLDWVNQQPLSRNVICLGDGHDGVWNIIEQIGTIEQRREVLDWYHLMENLHKVKGSSAVIEGVFKANNDKWSGFAYHIEEILDAGNSVVVIGKYSGRDRISDKPMSAAAVHIYDLREGKVCRFRMFADTKSIWNAMTD